MQPKDYHKILVTAKVDPDPDGFACIYAYAKLLNALGKPAVGGVWGIPHIEGRYISQKYKIADVVYGPKGDFGQIILVDASDIKGMPPVVKPEKVIEVIDHRQAIDVNHIFPKAKIQIEVVGAAATLITEKFIKNRVKPDFSSAILLYTTIWVHTAKFKISVANERDRRAASYLENLYGFGHEIIDELFKIKYEDTVKNLAEIVIKDFKTFEIFKHTIGIAQLEIENAGSLIYNNKGQLLKIIDDLSRKNGLEFNMLNVVDLSGNVSYFLSRDRKVKKILAEVFGVIFKNDLAKYPQLILRKEIFPKLNDYFKQL
jgi:inorganic pyrophosphatase/exopolyphosphatase